MRSAGLKYVNMLKKILDRQIGLFYVDGNYIQGPQRKGLQKITNRIPFYIINISLSY